MAFVTTCLSLCAARVTTGKDVTRERKKSVRSLRLSRLRCWRRTRTNYRRAGRNTCMTGAVGAIRSYGRRKDHKTAKTAASVPQDRKKNEPAPATKRLLFVRARARVFFFFLPSRLNVPFDIETTPVDAFRVSVKPIVCDRPGWV